MIEVGHASHTGLRREFNQDSYWADTELGLFLVVDGMGGYGRGEVAAALARDALADAARAGRPLEPAIRETGASIAAFSSAAPGHSPTGATLASLKIDGDRFEIARIGDARAYLRHHDTLLPQCADDGPPMRDDHEVSVPAAETAAVFPKRNRLTQALGITPPQDLCAGPVHGMLERGMQFLLCTDGLIEELDNRQIATMLARTDLAAQECVDHLLLAALDAGGRDNMTALLVRVV